MGKITLHTNACFFYCDWTGFPLDRKVSCYMPVWRNNKLLKKGVYFNWESVLAHAKYMHTTLKSMNEDEYAKVYSYVINIVGCDIKDAPHFNELEHFTISSINDHNVNAQRFHELCEELEYDANCIILNAKSCEVISHTFRINAAQCQFARVLGKSEHNSGAQIITTPVELSKKCRIAKDRAIYAVHFELGQGQPYNATASRIMQQRVEGNVIFKQTCREEAMYPRQRCIEFSKKDYTRFLYNREKRKLEECVAVDAADYSNLKSDLQASLACVESSISLDAQPPHELARAAVRPPVTGKELAKLAESVLGHKRPKKGEAPPVVPEEYEWIHF
ncbi:hypothetical protein [Pleurochrysis sp. endemic virus 1a]|nr:hypothetical protein [Pleurochrysis sp. endemic virus 1a]|mmetsp:Transcript_29428/g.64443  ORF Transcript_29428/g.64443 Transcript_29428/m.64443 type:complete len:333 (-) Transcript_29428:4630-5628(-)